MKIKPLFPLIAVLFVGLLVSLYFNFQKPKTPIVETQLPTAIPTKSTDPTADWKTYTSKEWKFSIKYPANWKVITFQKPTFDILPPQSEYYSDGGVNVSLGYNYSPPAIPSSWVKYDILSAKVYDNSTWAARNNETNSIIFQKNNIQVDWSANFTDEVTKETYDQILSTFKFIDTVESVSTMPVKIYLSTDGVNSCESTQYKTVNLPKTNTPLKDSINYLITNDKGFKLVSAVINNGVATLTFDDPNYYSSGGSCWAFDLSSRIEKTALQFPSVKSVKFKGPDHLFQP